VFIQHLRWIADGELDDPVEAVKSYHAALEKVGVRPCRSLDDDLKPTPARTTAYGGGAAVRVDGGKQVEPKKAAKPQALSGGQGGTPDFARMTPAEKVAWNLARWDRALK
jgi:hypothetical protein